jgi:UDP-N-acetyl-D-galactosamine dehydrogenase
MPDALSTALANGMKCTCDLEDVKDCNVYVVAIPTPVDDFHNPELLPLKMASESVGKVVKKGDTMLKQDAVVHGCKCLEKGILLDIFTPMREDFV